MKAIIPAAGIGKRSQSHTLNPPKVRVPVAGKPILEHIAESLFVSGFDKLSVIVGVGSRIMNYTGKINIGDNDTADNDHKTQFIETISERDAVCLNNERKQLHSIGETRC